MYCSVENRDLWMIWHSAESNFCAKSSDNLHEKAFWKPLNNPMRLQTGADIKLSWLLLDLTSDSCLSGRVSIPLWSCVSRGASASSSMSACMLGFSFSHFAKPLFFPAFPWNLDFILGKVWEPESFQPGSCQSGSVCVAWLVVTRCSRTEIFREEPVTRVIALPSRSWCSAATLGNSNTSSWTEREGEIVSFTYSASRSSQKGNNPGGGRGGNPCMKQCYNYQYPYAAQKLFWHRVHRFYSLAVCMLRG